MHNETSTSLSASCVTPTVPQLNTQNPPNVDNDEDEAMLLQELRNVSIRREKMHNDAAAALLSSSSASGKKDDDTRYITSDVGTTAGFLNLKSENSSLNQYWYSEHTIQVLCNAIMEGLDKNEGNRVAFLSTPSLYYSLPLDRRKTCFLFEVSNKQHIILTTTKLMVSTHIDTL